MKRLFLTLIISMGIFTKGQTSSFTNEPSINEIILLAEIDDANHLFSERDYQTAIDKFQTVIETLKYSGLDNPSVFLQALCGSMFCYDLLDQDAFAKAAFEELVYQVAVNWDRIQEINWITESPIYPYFQQINQRNYPRFETISLPESTPEEACQFQCAGYSVAAAYACGRVPHPAIQFACLGCIFALEQLCSRCCKEKGFWENCVKGLRRLFHDPEHPENPAPHRYE